MRDANSAISSRSGYLIHYLVVVFLLIATISTTSLCVTSSTTKTKFDDGSTEVMYDSQDPPTRTLPAGCTIFHASVDVEGIPIQVDDRVLLNFNDTNTQGWYGGFTTSSPENAPSSYEANAIGSGDIAKLTQEEGTFLRTHSDFPNDWPYHHFSFKVTTAPAFIEKISVHWKGRAEAPIFSPDRFSGSLLVWKNASSNWEELDNYGMVNFSGLQALDGEITQNFADYLDQENRFHVFTQHYSSGTMGDYLDTDFVEVVVDGQSGMGSVTDPTLRLSDGGTPVWSYSGDFSTKITLGDSDLKAPVQALSDEAEAGSNDEFTIEFLVDFTGSGKFKISNLSIEYGFSPNATVEKIMASFDEDTDAEDLVDLLDYFDDDMGTGNLAFEIIYEEDDTKIDGDMSTDGHSMSFTTPTEHWNGIMTFGVRVTDGDGLSTEFNNIEIAVLPVNDPPIALGIPDQVGTEDEACADEFVDLWDYFEDGAPNEDSVEDLSYLLPPQLNPTSQNKTATGQIVNNRYFTCTPSKDFNGPVTFVIEVRDTDSAQVRDSFIVDFAPVNDPPVFTSEPVKIAEEGKEYVYNIEVMDIDGDSVSLSLAQGSGNMTIDGTALTWVPGPTDVGSHNISLAAMDAEATTHQDFLLVVVNENNPPTIGPFETQKAIVGQTFKKTIVAEDPDIGINPVETLTYSDDTELFDIDPVTGKMTYAPTWVQVGTYYINISVVDCLGAQATAEMKLEVVFPPGTGEPGVEITSPENGSKVKIKKEIDFAVTMTDGGAGEWNYSWEIDGTQVAYGKEVKLSFDKKGSHVVKVTASDGNGTVEDSITITAKPKASSGVIPGFNMLAIVFGLLVALAIAGIVRRTE
jgi:hypothetical protein